MTHISDERFGEYNNLTPEEEKHTHECDYCLESVLMGEKVFEVDEEGKCHYI
jgi:hypothetical protein